MSNEYDQRDGGNRTAKAKGAMIKRGRADQLKWIS
jgi:hypothetical protein